MPGTASAAPGDPYVVYTANSFASGAVVLRTDPASGALVEVSRNGAQGNLFQRPYDLAVEPDGDLLVADLAEPCTVQTEPCPADGRIIRVDPLTGAQSLVAQGGQLVDPAGIALGSGNDLWVADNLEPDGDGRVVRVDRATGAQQLVAEDELLDLPFGIALDRDGTLLVANRLSPSQLPPGCQPLGRIVRVDPADGDQDLVTEAGDIAWPLGLAVAADGSIVVANECGTPGGLVSVDPLGGAQDVLTSNDDEDVLVTPERIAFDPSGALLVSDFALGADGDGGIARVDPETGDQVLVRAGGLFNHPLGIAAVVNRPPAARLDAAPRVVAAGRPVRLDASRSSDPEGLRLVYEWDLDGDGSFEAGSGTTPAATRTFGTHGPAVVRMRVNDPHGGRSVAEAGILVDGALPVISRLRARPRIFGGRRRATRIRFTMSEPAALTLVLERARKGRRRAGEPCRRRARRGRRCTIWKQAREPFTRLAAAGENVIRLRARGLRRGRHRLVLSARDAVGNEGVDRSVRLRVVRRRQPKP